jgi:hypothetical protein
VSTISQLNNCYLAHLPVSRARQQADRPTVTIDSHTSLARYQQTPALRPGLEHMFTVAPDQPWP